MILEDSSAFPLMGVMAVEAWLSEGVIAGGTAAPEPEDYSFKICWASLIESFGGEACLSCDLGLVSPEELDSGFT